MLSEEQVAEYREQGFLKVEQLFTSDEAEEANTDETTVLLADFT